MHKYKFHAFTALLVILALAVASYVGINRFDIANAETGGTVSDSGCPTGTSVFIDNSASTAGAILAPGVHKVSLPLTQTLAPQVRSVIFTIDGENILGKGLQVNSNPYWEMQWLTQSTPSGPHTVGATVTLSTGTCKIPATPVTVHNETSAQGQIKLTSTPAAFEGLTNEPRNFVLKATATGSTVALDITPWAYFKINPITLGAITPADGSSNFRFSAGPTAGTSVISVEAQYGGASGRVEIPVKILAQTAAASTTTTTGSSATTGSTATQSTASSNTAALESDAPVRDCVVAKIGEPRYKLITAGQERPTSAEFEAFSLCFAVRNYVIPSNMVPVEASKESIQKTPASNVVKVDTAANVTVTRDGAKKQILKFGGKAKPNIKVLVYIFSEPLVVATSADSNGDWSYSLEDPLEPGKHEAYALVDKGDGNYERSSVFSFAVAKVSAASANPNGLSLNLERNQPTAQKNTLSIKLYLGAITMLVLVVILAAWSLRRRKLRNNQPAATIPAPAVVQPESQPGPESNNTDAHS